MASTDSTQANSGADRAPTLGPLRATHGKSRSFLLTGWLLGLLFAVAGVLVLSLTRPMTGVRFDGNISLLYTVGFAGLALGVGIPAFIWRLTASQPTLRLYENGVRATAPGMDETVLYRDLEDLYVFMTGGIGFRASPGRPWIFTGARISAYARLTQALIDRQIAHRGALLLDRLQDGQTVVFRYVDDDVARAKSLVASRRLDFPTRELTLSASSLTIDRKSIALDRLGGVSTNSWSEQSRLMDKDGKVFHTIHPSAILSFDLLNWLIDRLQQTRQAA